MSKNESCNMELLEQRTFVYTIYFQKNRHISECFVVLTVDVNILLKKSQYTEELCHRERVPLFYSIKTVLEHHFQSNCLYYFEEDCKQWLLKTWRS